MSPQAKDIVAAGPIGVVGVGMMGAGIAQVLAVGGYEVRCIDSDPAAARRATSEIVDGRFGLRNAVDRHLIDQATADAALGRISFERDLAALGEANLIIEAIPETLEAKIGLFRQLDGICADKTVFATNSSGFPVASLAAATDRPDRVLAWHWASPAPAMRFAEIVRTRLTSAETVEYIVDTATGVGKRPIVVADTERSWGYVANRVYRAAADEAQRVADEGVATSEQIDQLLVDCFRWPVGPFALFQSAEGEGW